MNIKYLICQIHLYFIAPFSNMQSIIFVILIIIGVTLSLLTIIMRDYYTWTVPLNKVHGIIFSHYHTIPNNESFHSTLGDIKIINDDSIRVTFNNENGYIISQNDKYLTNNTANWCVDYIYNDDYFYITPCGLIIGSKLFPRERTITHIKDPWRIPEQFTYQRIVNKGDMFIAHCEDMPDHDEYFRLNVLELEHISAKNDIVTFAHYSALISEDYEICKHPQIIERSFDIDWNKFNLERIKQVPYRMLGLNEQFRDPNLSCTVSDSYFKKYYKLTNDKDKGTVTIHIDVCGGLTVFEKSQRTRTYVACDGYGCEEKIVQEHNKKNSH